MQSIFFLIIIVFATSCLAQETSGPITSQEVLQLKQVLSEKEAVFDRLHTQNEALLAKVDALQQLMLDREADIPRLTAQAQTACRFEMEMMKKDLALAQLTAVEKTEHAGRLEKEKDSWQYKIDMLLGEKIALRQSLKLVADELEAVNRDRDEVLAGFQKQLAALQASTKKTESELKSRLSNEQLKVQEKIVLAKKPLEARILALEETLKVKEMSCLEQTASAKERVEEKVRQREEQIAILRESAGREIKKAQDASAMEVSRIQEQLSACRAEKK